MEKAFVLLSISERDHTPGELIEEKPLQSTTQQNVLHQVVPFSIGTFPLPKWFPFQCRFQWAMLVAARSEKLRHRHPI